MSNKVKFVGLTFLHQGHILLVKEPDGFNKTTPLSMKWGIPGGGPNYNINIMDSTFMNGSNSNIDKLLVQEACREFFEETMGLFGSIVHITELLYQAIQDNRVMVIGIPPHYFAFYIIIDELPINMNQYNVVFSNFRHFITECGLYGSMKPDCLEITELKFVPLTEVKELNLRRTINDNIINQIISWIQKKNE